MEKESKDYLVRRLPYYVSLRIAAQERAFVVEYHDQVVKEVPLKGLVGERVPWEGYVEQIAEEAQQQLVAGRPMGKQLRLPLSSGS